MEYHPPAANGDKGTLSLRLTATTSGDFRLDDNAVKRVDAVFPASSKYWLKSGDLLVQRANTIEYVGSSAIFDGPEHTYIYPDLMMRIRIEDELIRKYVWRYLNSPIARRYFQERASGTSGNMPKITGRILMALPIQVPPREQISIILDSIDRLYERLKRVAAENQRCSLLVDKLEMSFLKRALDGRLVKQSQSDSPSARILNHTNENKAHGEENKSMSTRGPQTGRDAGARAHLDRQLDFWPSEGITFEQLRAEAPGSYEELKDLLFELMETNRIGQRYDSRERKMKLVKLA